MKVKIVMTVSRIIDIDLKDHPQAEDIDDAIEQDLVQYQDDETAQQNLLADADMIEVTAKKLTVTG